MLQGIMAQSDFGTSISRCLWIIILLIIDIIISNPVLYTLSRTTCLNILKAIRNLNTIHRSEAHGNLDSVGPFALGIGIGMIVCIKNHVVASFGWHITRLG